MRYNRLNHFFWALTGEDRFIIELSHVSTQNRLRQIGQFSFFIIVLSFLSSTFFVYSILDGLESLVSILIGIFWGALVGVLYIFLLYTISPTFLPKRTNAKSKPDKTDESISTKDRFKFPSINTITIFRFIAIGGLAFIIAQPINEKIFLNKILNKLQISNSLLEFEENRLSFKASMINTANAQALHIDSSYLKRIDSIAIKSLSPSELVTYGLLKHKYLLDSSVHSTIAHNLDSLGKLGNFILTTNARKAKDSIINASDNLIKSYVEQCKLFQSQFSLEDEFSHFDSSIYKANEEFLINYSKLDHFFNATAEDVETPFYLLRISTVLSSSIGAWIVTFAMMVFFCWPIYSKNKLRFSNPFWESEDAIPYIDKGIQALRNKMFSGENWYLLQSQIFKINKIDLEGINDFYFVKALVESRIIFNEYAKFKKDYFSLLKENFHIKLNACAEECQKVLDLSEVDDELIENIISEYRDDANSESEKAWNYPEPWLDPPFNTISKRSADIKANKEMQIFDTLLEVTKDENGLRRINPR